MADVLKLEFTLLNFLILCFSFLCFYVLCFNSKIKRSIGETLHKTFRNFSQSLAGAFRSGGLGRRGDIRLTQRFHGHRFLPSTPMAKMINFLSQALSSVLGR